MCISRVSNVSFVRDPRCKFEKSLEALAVSSADWNGIIKEACHGFFCRAEVHTVSHLTVSNHLHSWDVDKASLTVLACTVRR